MREYAEQRRSPVQPAPEWLFLTAADRDMLALVLSAYQPAASTTPPHRPGR
jgi:hypothetical protein